MIMRADHADGFFVIRNEPARDDRLSLAARGLLVYMLSMSDDWVFSISGIMQAHKLSRQTAVNLVKELENAGYILIKKEHDKAGKFSGKSWTIYELPQNHSPENRNTEKQTTANTVVYKTDIRQNRSSVFQTNKNNQILEVPNTKKDQVLIQEKHKRKPAGTKNNIFLTAEERERLNQIIGAENAGRYIDLLSYYLNEHPEIKYKNHFQTILRWFERDHKAKGA